MLENKIRGKKQNIDEAAKKISIETAQLAGTLQPQDKKQLEAANLLTENDEEIDKKQTSDYH